MDHPIDHLYRAVQLARSDLPEQSRAARLLKDGNPKIAKKVVEEAAEVALDAVVANRDGVIQESVDLIYNLTVLWVWMGINPAEVWHEMERREQEFGIAGKLPKEQP